MTFIWCIWRTNGTLIVIFHGCKCWNKTIQVIVWKSICLLGQFSFQTTCPNNPNVTLLSQNDLIIMVPSNVLAGSSAKCHSESDLALFQPGSCSVCQDSLCVPQQQLRSHFEAWCIQQLVVPSPGWAWEEERKGGWWGWGAWGRLSIEP